MNQASQTVIDECVTALLRSLVTANPALVALASVRSFGAFSCLAHLLLLLGHSRGTLCLLLSSMMPLLRLLLPRSTALWP